MVGAVGGTGTVASKEVPRFVKDSSIISMVKKASAAMHVDKFTQGIINMVPQSVQKILTPQRLSAAFQIGTIGLAGATLTTSLAAVWQRFKAVRQAASTVEKASQMEGMTKMLASIVPKNSIALMLIPMVGVMAVGLISHFKKKYEQLKPIQSNFEYTDEETVTKWEPDNGCGTKNGKYVDSAQTKNIIDNLNRKIIGLKDGGETISMGTVLYGPGGTGKSHLSDKIAEKFYSAMDSQGKLVVRFKITPADFQEHGPEKMNKILESLKIIKSQMEEKEKAQQKKGIDPLDAAEKGEAAQNKGIACVFQFEEMDAVFRSVDQQKQFQTFSDALKNAGVDSCFIGTANETKFLEDASGQQNEGLKRRFETGGWHKIDYPNKEILEKVLTGQLEEFKFNGDPLDGELRTALVEEFGKKLGADYKGETGKLTPAGLNIILANTKLNLIDEDKSQGKEVKYTLDKDSVIKAFKKAFESQKEQAALDLLKSTAATPAA